MGVTSRQALPYPEPTDPADGPGAFQALAEAADQSSFTLQGSLASRPAAGKQGRFYWATDVTTFYLDTGSTWVTINPAGVVDGPAGTPSLRTLGTGTLQAASGADSRLSDQRVPTDGSVTAAKVANSLKPSAGAGGGTESLRALGTGPGYAASGSHAAQHQFGGADQLAINWAQMVGTPITWIDLPLTSGVAPVVNVGGSYANHRVPQYGKDALGFVHLRGTGYCTAPAGVASFGTLPAGFRPTETEIFVVHDNSVSPSFVSWLRINSAGGIDKAMNQNTVVSLSGIHFTAA
jgi:hypothetical protein